MNKPNLMHTIQLPPLRNQRRERYLPTAFDESLSILEKMDKMIHYIHEYAGITEDMLGKWNEVYRWVMNEGLDDTIVRRIRELLDDGTFKRIINEEIFSDLSKKISDVESTVNNFKNEVNDLFDKLEVELSNDLNKQLDEFGNTINKFMNEINKKMSTFIEDISKVTTSIIVSNVEPTDTIKDKTFWYKEVSM